MGTAEFKEKKTRNPVIFVPGVGLTGSDWKRIDMPGHPTFYFSFSDNFASPASLVPELAKYIDEVLQKTKKKKVILVCHSMGGLVARRYLTLFKDFHRVEKIVMISVPNLGSYGLFFNWLPPLLVVAGLWGYRYIWPLFLSLVGAGVGAVYLSRHFPLLTPAAWTLRPGSKFLKKLNADEMPEDVKYVTILSETNYIFHRVVNVFLLRESGDGAVGLRSQRLSAQCVPNFSRLDYSEFQVNLTHLSIPRRVFPVVYKAIGT